MKILDLDMDYFMSDIVSGIPDSCEERLDEECYGNAVWKEEKVRQFLEHNLGLTKANKIPGRVVSGHNEALFFWEELVNSKRLTEPFEVVHVDSHADLGLCGSACNFLQNEFLYFPTESRRRIRNYYDSDDRIKEISIGDYLLWAVAYRMVSSITYCANPCGNKNDYRWETLKDFHEDYIFDEPVKNCIQLKYNRKMEIPTHDSPGAYKKRYLDGAIKDPEVELVIIPTVEGVKFSGDFDYVVMAQSPNYTPASADFIMDIFREYIEEI